MDLTPLRLELEEAGLSPAELSDDPFELFDRWYRTSVEVGVHEPEAMVLATATPDAVPSARFVLLKGVDDRGFVFYTNRRSRKADELAANQAAALVFPWIQLSRQVRVEGAVTPVGDAEADDYFSTRPRGSQIGAWASEQSAEIPDRAWLDDRVAEAERRFEGQAVERPPHWGGYVLAPDAVEFWQGRTSRLHDRFRYERAADGWRSARLSP